MDVRCCECGYLPFFVCDIQLIIAGDNGDNTDTVSLRHFADNATCSALTVLLSVSLVNSAFAVDLPHDIILRLCLPRASETSYEIRAVVGVLDFVRFVLFVCLLINVHSLACS